MNWPGYVRLGQHHTEEAIAPFPTSYSNLLSLHTILKAKSSPIFQGKYDQNTAPPPSSLLLPDNDAVGVVTRQREDILYVSKL